jgi:hypothetical protein
MDTETSAVAMNAPQMRLAADPDRFNGLEMVEFARST